MKSLEKKIKYSALCSLLSPWTPTSSPQLSVYKFHFMLLYSLSVSGLLTLLFTLPPLTLDFLMHTHHSSCAPLSEICTGRTARAAVRDGVPVPEGGGRTHLRVWGCYHGRGCSQDCPANHQAAGQHELGGCWLLHQQAPGKRARERRWRRSYFMQLRDRNVRHQTPLSNLDWW